jgi:FecR protein
LDRDCAGQLGVVHVLQHNRVAIQLNDCALRDNEAERPVFWLKESAPMITRHRRRIAGFLTATLALLAPAFAHADEGDPPSRVARLAFVQGSVSLQPGGTTDWIAAPLNRPLTSGDQLWSDQDSRVELQLDGSLLRLSSNTAVSILNLNDNVTQIQLTAGSLLVRVRRLDENETYEIDTPNLAFSVLRPGLYRITIDGSGNTTAIRVRSGQGEVTGGGSAYAVNANEYAVFSGTDELAEDSQSAGPQDDAFDGWSAGRDARWQQSPSARYVSPDVVGYEDLDDQGNWSSTPEYGYVWIPRGVESGWAPYHNGHWSYVAPWGYTWVDDQPWGFAPFHYGRWISVNGAWGWVPAPPRAAGVVYVRPVYAPALVAWVGVGANIAWFALGPREVFVPSYPVSRAYVNNINVSNTTVNKTVINNVYNTTIINNKTVNVTTVNYVNRAVPGAIAVTTSQAFSSAQPVSRNRVQVDQRTLASAQVRTVVPAEVPTKQAVLGAARVVDVKPPAAVQTRAIIARTTPPPPPPAFEKRQEAIKNNGGSPLSSAQVHSIQATMAPRPIPVKIAPAATPVKSAQAPKPVAVPSASPKAAPLPEPAPATKAVAAPTQTPKTEPTRSTVAAVHPKEVAAPAKPVSPNDANTALERQHLQEQQQLQARQEQQRQQVQQQQEREHAQLAKQNADDAKKKQLEQQHQQQTQQLVEQHARAQQQLQAQQEEQRRQQEAQAQQAQAKNKNKPPEHPPNPKPQS